MAAARARFRPQGVPKARVEPAVLQPAGGASPGAIVWRPAAASAPEKVRLSAAAAVQALGSPGPRALAKARFSAAAAGRAPGAGWPAVLAQGVALPPAEPVAWDAAAGPRWAGGHAPGAPQQAA